MTTENWIDLNDIQAVACAQADGWEIIATFGYNNTAWEPWSGEYWLNSRKFRGRPRQPKMKEVKMECFLIDGELRWRDENLSILGDWVRQPQHDLIAKVSE